jgi:hypothetical protein
MGKTNQGITIHWNTTQQNKRNEEWILTTMWVDLKSIMVCEKKPEPRVHTVQFI